MVNSFRCDPLTIDSSHGRGGCIVHHYLMRGRWGWGLTLAILLGMVASCSTDRDNDKSEQGEEGGPSTWTSCDGALWASELCDSGHPMPLGISRHAGRCCAVDEQPCSFSPSAPLTTTLPSPSPDGQGGAVEVVLLVDSTFGDVHCLCGCNPQREQDGTFCTDPPAPGAWRNDTDLRPFDWVVFGLVKRPGLPLRHLRCPFVGHERRLLVRTAIFTDRELRYALQLERLGACVRVGPVRARVLVRPPVLLACACACACGWGLNECVRACMRERAGAPVLVIDPLSCALLRDPHWSAVRVCACACVRVLARARVCACARARVCALCEHARASGNVCVCVCVVCSVCARADLSRPRVALCTLHTH